jgi:hypothetical protein
LSLPLALTNFALCFFQITVQETKACWRIHASLDLVLGDAVPNGFEIDDPQATATEQNAD